MAIPYEGDKSAFSVETLGASNHTALGFAEKSAVFPPGFGLYLFQR
ncbi:hypothetical protein [uncultured Desulfovibrio sp.]|nr:hypothetical protein [uncultured Desulfovibrio sp.]